MPIEHITPRKLAEWIMTLPPEIQDGYVMGLIVDDAWPCQAKRVCAIRSKEMVGGTVGIIINPMGTHLKDVLAEKYEFVSTLD